LGKRSENYSSPLVSRVEAARPHGFEPAYTLKENAHHQVDLMGGVIIVQEASAAMTVFGGEKQI